MLGVYSIDEKLQRSRTKERDYVCRKEKERVPRTLLNALQSVGKFWEN
jgi:hypothetical protein